MNASSLQYCIQHLVLVSELVHEIHKFIYLIVVQRGRIVSPFQKVQSLVRSRAEVNTSAKKALNCAGVSEGMSWKLIQSLNEAVYGCSIHIFKVTRFSRQAYQQGRL